MPFVPLDKLCPEVAERETRTITLPEPALGLPAGEYGFVEMYCDERGCDCRRVLFSVVSRNSHRIEAVISWGWEELAFYERWLGGFDKRLAMEMKGPALNIGSPQSRNAPALVELFRETLLTDSAYVERIKRHYAAIRSKIAVSGRLPKAPRRKPRK